TLGQSIVLTLNTISIYSLYNTSFSTPVYIGTKILAPQKVLHDPLSGTFYYLRSPYLIKDKLGILDSVNVEFNEYAYASLDSDGKTIFLTNETKIQEISTENFVLKNSYTIPNPILSLLNFESNFLIASLNGSSLGHLSLYNKSTSAIQNYGSIQHWLNAFSKSKTPGYILGTGSGIYVFKVSEIGEIESYENISGQIAVFNSDGNFIYVFDNLSKGKYSFPDLEFVEGSSTNLYLSELRGFDETNGYYAENTGNGLLIRSLETSAIIKRIYTPSNGYSFIKNGRAFCTVGAYSYYIDY
ncbi:MAG TPA: hypothetical protein PKJ83_10365, partial [Cyclobacteriaceae bacterium]|nr:hypothetical protein [Cyclobacteriaceae bacterium]